MVAIIKTGHSVLRILNYNENKVNEGVANCLCAQNFPADPDQMNFSMKHNFFLKQLQLNENVTRNSVHISLNFHGSENNLPAEKLVQIASGYMEGIGFGEQPYLVYQHNDAGHPHIHIVSIKVRADGTRIDMNNIGKNQSEDTRKAIEQKFNLVKAEQQQKQDEYQLPERVSATKVQYGKTETKRAIQNVLEAVIDNYKYTSLAELNAVLRLYNVTADRGSETSQAFKKDGLYYRIIDKESQPVGVPIKASLFYSKPTLKNLREKFETNEDRRKPHMSRIRAAIDRNLSGQKIDLEQLIKALEKQGIATIFRQNEAGFIYGITYVDHQTKSVFNGSKLGTAYSAKGILERCAAPSQSQQNKQLPQVRHRNLGMPALRFARHPDGTIISDLLKVEEATNFIPSALRPKKKKRRKK